MQELKLSKPAEADVTNQHTLNNLKYLLTDGLHEFLPLPYADTLDSSGIRAITYSLINSETKENTGVYLMLHQDNTPDSQPLVTRYELYYRNIVAIEVTPTSFDAPTANIRYRESQIQPMQPYDGRQSPPVLGHIVGFIANWMQRKELFIPIEQNFYHHAFRPEIIIPTLHYTRAAYQRPLK